LRGAWGGALEAFRRRADSPARWQRAAPCGLLRRVTQFAWFVAGVATWFGAWGMQSVLFSWIVVGELHAGPEWVSAAQTASMLPTLFLLLFYRFLGLIAVAPSIIQGLTGITTIVIGGTALLIAVQVSLDLVRKIDAQVSLREY